MNLKIIIFILYALALFINICSADSKHFNDRKNYLYQPTGVYQVSVNDLHWKNNNLCFKGNKNGCSDIAVKIYYPTTNHYQSRVLYNQTFMKTKQQEILDKIPNIPKEQLNQLNQIKSYSVENAPIVVDKKFPVLILSPGGSCPAALYENFITELVSHGYIVVGIDTQFSGDTKSDSDLENKDVPFDKKVLIYVFKKIHSLHNSNSLFSAMDLNHIGLFGHSIGGRVIADVAHAHSNWFQAVATFDIGFDTSGKSRNKFDIPILHLLAASTKFERTTPLAFQLGKNNFLIVLSPSEQNPHYSRHMNFTDLSTLQYLPAFQSELSYFKQQAEEKFDLKFMTHSPTEKEFNNFGNPTYVLINQDNKWDIEYFKIATDKTHPKRGPYHFVGGTNSIKGLNASLVVLPHKNIESFTDDDAKPIKEILISFQRNTVAEPFGTGNGWQLTSSINTYLVQFFNTFLKNEVNPAFKNCAALSKDTLIKCGSE